MSALSILIATYVYLFVFRRVVAFLKRAQIFAADVWNRFGGHGYGEFHDIDALTMFADYRYLHIFIMNVNTEAHNKYLSLSPLSLSLSLSLSFTHSHTLTLPHSHKHPLLRVPQTLLYLNILTYEPTLMEKLKAGTHISPGSQEEVEIRGCSIWAVEVSGDLHNVVELLCCYVITVSTMLLLSRSPVCF